MIELALWLARVGGGESYSGGGGGYSGGGGGGGDGIGILIELLIRLVFYYPQVGIPLLIVAAVVYFKLNSGSRPAYEVGREWSHQATPQRRSSADVRLLQQLDPNFSRPLFLDFLSLLYTRVAHGRGRAYLQVEPPNEPREDVIVGSIRLIDVASSGGWVSVKVAFETNFKEQGRALYSVEEWTLGRKAGVLSKPPDEILKLACPNCGNPSEVGTDGICPYCDTRVNDGRFSWVVTAIQVIKRVPAPPIALAPGGQEIGTELPTRYSPDLAANKRMFLARNPDFQWPAFQQRVVVTFLSLQEAWSTQQWEKARPFETDHLFESHRYWIEAYRREGLRNVLEEVQVGQVVPVRVDVDAYYEAMTVRLWASMLDYTVKVETGQVVGGDRSHKRSFTEYWTFIRRVGHTPAKSLDPGRCPSCGAPLDKVSQSGVCGYCDTKITRGDFDWVLSAIEQDEAYQP